MTPLLVVVGNLIVDDVVYENGGTELGQPGGAALYAALGAALWGVRVGISSVVGEDYPEHVLEALAEKKVDLGGVRRVAGPGLRTWLLYEGRRRQIVHRLGVPPHAVMSPRPEDLPGGWNADGYHLAPMPLPIQTEWLSHSRHRKDVLLSLDPFALVDGESLASLQQVFSRADLVLLSEDELLLDSSLDDPERALADLARAPDAVSGRLQHIFLKRGARGGLIYDLSRRRSRSWRPNAAWVVEETTGAGDAFAGGLVAALLCGRPVTQAVKQALVSASFALETRGADGLLRATPGECANRYSSLLDGESAR